MYTALILYGIGFFLLTPEFLVYLNSISVMLMDMGFVVGAIILLSFLRKCVREESSLLQIMQQTQNELLEK